MSQTIRSAIIATYLLLCILLGGSSQGVWTNLSLQLLGVALIAWAALAPQSSDPEPGSKMIYLLLGSGAIVVLAHLVPLPASIWTQLPGRGEVAAALELTSNADTSLPISLTPYTSVMTLFAAIPALAVFVSAKVLHPPPRWLALAICTGLTISIALGALQVAGGRNSGAYFYHITSPGAVGVFANVNHMGTLLVVAIPFVAALLLSWKSERAGAVQARWTLGLAAIVLLAIGIALNGSRAALALGAPVALASAVLLLPVPVRWRPRVLIVAILAVGGGVLILTTTPITTGIASAPFESGATSRPVIWSTTFNAIRDTFPIGTGLGSFEQVYRLYEGPGSVTRVYVNHAHNDYLQLVLELGAPGLLLILLFLGWWAVTAARIWMSPLSTPFERAATIASAAILAHSIVDFPLRTAAISAVFATAIAMMTGRSRRSEADTGGLQREARHLKIG